MQNNLEISVLEAGYENLKSSLMNNLEAKGRSIRDARQKDLTEASVRRINSEEKHIKLCVGVTDAGDNLIKALQLQIQELREKASGQNKKINWFYAEMIEAQNLSMILQEKITNEEASK
jgi:hypothetical protein